MIISGPHVDPGVCACCEQSITPFRLGIGMQSDHTVYRLSWICEPCLWERLVNPTDVKKSHEEE